jgi:hypothetical protein
MEYGIQDIGHGVWVEVGWATVAASTASTHFKTPKKYKNIINGDDP